MLHKQRVSIRFVLHTVGLIVLTCLAAPAASAVTLLEDNREVLIAGDFEPIFIHPTTPFENFLYEDFNGQILQSSSVSPDGFAGQGYARGIADMGFSSFRFSTFDIVFSTESATFIDLQGTLDGQAGDTSTATGLAFVELYDGSNTLLYREVGGDSNMVLFDFASLLPAGEYRLVLDMEIRPGEFQSSIASWEFQANFTAVPVPAAFWLFGTAILGLSALRSRRI